VLYYIQSLGTDVQDAPHPEGNVVLQKALSGLFRACQHDLVSEGALDFVRSFAKRVFAAELSREDPQPDGGNKYSPAAMRKGFSFLPLTSTVPDSFVYAFEDSRPSDYSNLAQLLTTVVADFQEMASGDLFVKKPEAAIEVDEKAESTPKVDDKAESTPKKSESKVKYEESRDPTTKVVDKIISAFVHRFTHICHEEDWARKMAGVAGLRGLLIDGNPHRRWIIDLEIDVVRSLLYCLRDAPKESPQSSEEVIEMIKHFIRTCQSQEDGRAKQQRLMDTLVSELHSSSKLARDSAQDFLALLAEVNETSISDLVGPTAKAKLLDGPAGPIFNKPLRALPFPIQVGIIDAVTWLVQLRPTVVDFSDEYIRLFHEVLALADVDDQALIGKPGLMKSEQWLKTLRISCIRLLRSSMATSEFQENANLAGSRTR
jgi:transformation/transcription domain-associated protein